MWLFPLARAAGGSLQDAGRTAVLQTELFLLVAALMGSEQPASRSTHGVPTLKLFSERRREAGLSFTLWSNLLLFHR